MALGLHRLHRADVERMLEHVRVGDVAVVATIPVVDAVAADVHEARVVDDHVGRYRAGIDSARKRHDLHHRSRLVDGARDVVEEVRRVGVDEVVRVVARVVGPRDDAAGRGVHDQNASALGVRLPHAGGEGLLGRVLDVGVER